MDSSHTRSYILLPDTTVNINPTAEQRPSRSTRQKWRAIFDAISIAILNFSILLENTKPYAKW